MMENPELQALPELKELLAAWDLLVQRSILKLMQAQMEMQVLRGLPEYKVPKALPAVQEARDRVAFLYGSLGMTVSPVTLDLLGLRELLDLQGLLEAWDPLVRQSIWTQKREMRANEVLQDLLARRDLQAVLDHRAQSALLSI